MVICDGSSINQYIRLSFKKLLILALTVCVGPCCMLYMPLSVIGFHHTFCWFLVSLSHLLLCFRVLLLRGLNIKWAIKISCNGGYLYCNRGNYILILGIRKGKLLWSYVIILLRFIKKFLHTSLESISEDF